MQRPGIYKVGNIHISYIERVLDADTPKSKKKFERSSIKSSRALLLRRYLRNNQIYRSSVKSLILGEQLIQKEENLTERYSYEVVNRTILTKQNFHDETLPPAINLMER